MRRTFINVIVIAILNLLMSGGVFAQHTHEISVYSGGGLSTLYYQVTTGEHKFGYGGHVGLGYHFFFTPKWGLGTGAEVALYNTTFNVKGLNTNYMITDMEGHAFEFRSVVNDYQERQSAMLLQIPLMLQFQTNREDSRRQFFMAVGGKFGIPMNGLFRNTTSLSNAGYYEYENSLYDTQEFMGFGNYNGRKNNGSWDFEKTFFAAFETGIKWKLNDNWSLYTGIYIDYGLNNIRKKQDVSTLPSFVAYNRAQPPDFAVNSIFESQHMQNGNSQVFTDHITPIAAGIKLRLTFGKNGKRSETKTTKKEKTKTETVYVEVVKECECECECECPTGEECNCPATEACDCKAAAEEEARKAAEAAALETAKKQIELPINNYSLPIEKVGDYQRGRLDEKIAILKQYPHLRFYIYGHTCDLGTHEANERVGLGRAENTKQYLISNGIDPSRILGIASKRDTEPLVPNTSEDNRKYNRRVEIIVEKK